MAASKDSGSPDDETGNGTPHTAPTTEAAVTAAKEEAPKASAPAKKKKKRSKKKAKKKAPGMFSFVAIRQYFMIFAAPGMATSLAPFFGEDANFMVVMIIFAVPSLVHGQLWKWTYDWSRKYHQNLRFGQIAIGALHVGLGAWALSRVATGEVPFEGAAFYHGLTIAGLAAGLWETVRPALELRKS